MKSVQRKFNEIQKANPFWSSFVVFSVMVQSGKFGRKSIYRWFNRLVDKNDFELSEKKSLLSHLVNLSKVPVESTN